MGPREPGGPDRRPRVKYAPVACPHGTFNPCARVPNACDHAAPRPWATEGQLCRRRAHRAPERSSWCWNGVGPKRRMPGIRRPGVQVLAERRSRDRDTPAVRGHVRPQLPGRRGDAGGDKRQGADAGVGAVVSFNGGQGVLGPQSTRILCGRKDLIEAAYMNAAPNSDGRTRTRKRPNLRREGPGLED